VSVFIACVTQNVAQCIPHITQNPNLCPVASGGFGCPGQIPGGPVQGGPVQGGGG
jgi:hypothetical protein